MRSSIARVVVLLVVSAAAVSISSCLAQSLKPGETVYSDVAGTLKTMESAPFDAVVRSTTTAMKNLSLKPMVRDKDGFRAFIVGETIVGQVSQSHELRVWVTRVDDKSTQIEMRILGRREEPRLRALHSEIQKGLASAGGDAKEGAATVGAATGRTAKS